MANFVLRENYSSVSFVYNGTEWNVLEEDPIILRTRVVTAGPTATLLIQDKVCVVNQTTAGAIAINLPASPLTGEIHIVKDGKGDAGTNAITIQPAAGTIDGGPSLTIGTNYGYAVVHYNGTEWGKIG